LNYLLLSDPEKSRDAYYDEQYANQNESETVEIIDYHI
jgi:hypothetical protein